jgi:hypothetical protein
MCEQCEGISTRQRVGRGRLYDDFIRQLIGMVDRKSLKLLSASLPLAEVMGRQVWNGEFLVHVFECTKCGRMFRLSLETDRGDSAGWEVMMSDSPRSIQ